MRKHARVYLKYFNLDESDTMRCECCTSVAVDIHHIFPRGMGGRSEADTIDNLMALCRRCHNRYGDKTKWRTYLLERHDYWMKTYGK